MTTRTLLLMRHAQAEDFVPGRTDFERPLTTAGRAQARTAGEFLADRGIVIDQVLCSGALRTRQTLDELDLDCPAEFLQELYNASSDTIIDSIGEVDPEVTVLLVVGHAPGVPTLADDLADPDDSPDADWQRLQHGFPTATVAALTLDCEWDELTASPLEFVRQTKP